VVRLGTNLETVLAQLGRINRGLGIGALVLLAVGGLIVWWRTRRS